MWTDDSSDPVLDDEGLHSARIRPPVQSHLLSCFNQSAKLCKLVVHVLLNDTDVLQLASSQKLS